MQTVKKHGSKYTVVYGCKLVTQQQNMMQVGNDAQDRTVGERKRQWQHTA